MKDTVSRRQFLSHSAAAGAVATLAAAPAFAAPAGAATAAASRPASTLPTAKIGSLTLSRLISGGNLLSGWAHARDLHYVPSLMRAYNTPDKVLDTLEKLEQQGVNALIADPRKNVMDLLARYWKERGGRIQWIAEGHPDAEDWQTNIRKSIEFGARAVYVQGVIGDRWLKEGRLDLLGRCVEFIKSQGVPGGIGAHQIEVVTESEQRGFHPDFYVKTCHHSRYWSARRPDQDLPVIDNPADNYWDMDPVRTVRVMSAVEKPWIAFKILAAGAIRPESGFRYALESGADFLCVGMFDFQVEANVALTRSLLADPAIQNRSRGWMA